MTTSFRLNVILTVSLFFLPAGLFAQTVSGLAPGVFAVSPAKQEIKVAAGDSVIRNIYITNRLGRDAEFSIGIEDVSGGNEVAIRYYGDGLGPYSIKRFALVGNERIKIADGEVKVVPVMIMVPVKTKPGGYYGAIFVKEIRPATAETRVTTRVGSLLFLRVAGEVIEKGELKGFSAGEQSIFWNSQPIEFQISFANSGNIYLNPYGLIEIADYRGQIVKRLPIDPWFVFPDSVRTRGVTWEKVPRLGYFKVTLYLNHGYSKAMATVTTRRILVVPFKLIVVVLAILALIMVIYRLRKKIRSLSTI
ncbi:MAG: hypothetical protein NTY66_02770 [Candidatus Vogelbacteria bacterium]|nr:hypothetical protein [Candidatus Vogelbacteria bacterium]